MKTRNAKDRDKVFLLSFIVVLVWQQLHEWTTRRPKLLSSFAQLFGNNCFYGRKAQNIRAGAVSNGYRMFSWQKPSTKISAYSGFQQHQLMSNELNFVLVRTHKLRYGIP